MSPVEIGHEREGGKQAFVAPVLDGIALGHELAELALGGHDEVDVILRVPSKTHFGGRVETQDR